MKKAPVPKAPILQSRDATSVTLVRIPGYEYRIGDGEWQKDSVFTGLSPNTEYVFFQRVAESDDMYFGEASEGLAIKTLKIKVEKPESPTVISVTENSVTLEYLPGYEYRLGNGEWQTSSVFEGLSASTEYKFYQRIAETEIISASEPSDATVVKTAELPFVLGDTNGDGVVDLTDAMAVLYHVAKKKLLPEDILSHCDINGDSEVDLTDAMKILYYVAKKIPSLQD